ncbi:MAG TPA: acyl-CoA desaturase [Planctomycetaceae bacterium]|nr:acyl-CoA desaturase [Planctomycetaceae bacterium]
MSDVVLDPPKQTESTNPQSVKFSKNEGFMSTLRARVDEYFDRTGQPQRDVAKMYVKTATILLWVAASYVLLVFGASAWWQAGLLAVSLGLALSAVGFNIQHDASHGAFSRFPLINRLLAMTLDCLGGSSYVWKWKHNVLHHSYTNIAGHDDDIELGGMGRLSPDLPRHGFHRFQHWYLWFLYGFIAVKWQWFDDFRNIAEGKIGSHKIPRPKGWDMAIFVLGKIFFFGMAFVLPMVFHKWYVVLGVYATVSFVQGVVLAVVFQLAHCVDEAKFLMPEPETGKMEHEWAIHQVLTTVDFARKSKVVGWYTGGLNFQIEHHLFPRISHVHYPAVSEIVEETCREFNVPYAANETFGSAVASHYRFLKRMGQPDPVAAG